MDLNPAGTTPKRSRSKAKSATATDTPAKPAAPRSRKSKSAATQVVPEVVPEVLEVTSITAITTPSEDELNAMIATTAYYLAEQRHFAPGHELDDWLQAERQVRTLHT